MQYQLNPLFDGVIYAQPLKIFLLNPHLRGQVLGASQAVFWFYWKTTPENECDEGNTGSNQKYKIFNWLKKNICY